MVSGYTVGTFVPKPRMRPVWLIQGPASLLQIIVSRSV